MKKFGCRLCITRNFVYLQSGSAWRTRYYAVVAQLVEHWLPKPRVTGSSPAYRSGLHQVVLCDNVVFLLKSTICCDDIISHS